MCGQIDIHNTVDLMSVVSQDMPIGVTVAFMESKRIKERIIASMTDVDNLSGLAFLYSSGQKSKIYSIM